MAQYITNPGTVYPTGDTIVGRAPDGVFVASPGTTAGTFAVNGTTPVVVSATRITANSQLSFTLNTIGGTVGAKPYEVTKTAGVGFSVVATAGNTSIYNWMILEPSVV